MTLTGAQQQAITAKGNVLVVAGAGTGKTRTLVERCLNCLLHETPPVSVDEILMVTFTEAAAAEMRQRIRKRLEQESVRPGKAGHWQRISARCTVSASSWFASISTNLNWTLSWLLCLSRKRACLRKRPSMICWKNIMPRTIRFRRRCSA
jgi:hypothetical protein